MRLTALDRPAPRDDLDRCSSVTASSRGGARSARRYRRFEWCQPGALLHIDAYKAPKFDAPGPSRRPASATRRGRARGLGKTVVIAVQDDHTRLVYTELHSAENAANVSITLKRAAAWLRRAGLRAASRRSMSDNAKCYTGHRFAADARTSSAPATSASRPTRRAGTARSNGSSAPSKTNGRTAASGPTPPPATAPCHRSSATSTAGSPHSAAGGRPPITRAQEVAGKTLSQGSQRATPRATSRRLIPRPRARAPRARGPRNQPSRSSCR